MFKYLAYRIIEGAYTYEFVISKRPEFKEGLDNALKELGRDDLIVS